MKLLAIVKSGEYGNTMQIAEAMAEVAPLTIAPFDELKYYRPEEYDAVGYGSGIVAGSHDRELIEYVKKLKDVPAYSFVFSTSATRAYGKHNKKLVRLLEKKGSTVVSAFGCKGFCNLAIFRPLGGIGKGHPDEQDFDSAQVFIQDTVKRLEAFFAAKRNTEINFD